MSQLNKTGSWMRVFIVVMGFILLTCNLCFAARLGELLKDFQAPQGYVLDSTTDRKMVFLNKEDDITMTVIGPVPENESTRIKDETFAQGVIAGLEDTRRVRINTHDIISSEGLTLIRLFGTADMHGDNQWIPRRSVTFSLADSMFEVALYGNNVNFRDTDTIFAAVIKYLKSKS